MTILGAVLVVAGYAFLIFHYGWVGLLASGASVALMLLALPRKP